MTKYFRQALLFLALSYAFLVSAQHSTNFPSKLGILWTSWHPSHYELHNKYIDDLQKWGIEYVSINPTYYIDTYEQGVITEYDGTLTTPTIATQKTIIKELLSRGFYINYRPHIDPIKFIWEEGSARRENYNAVPGGQNWRGEFDKLDPISSQIGYKDIVIMPGLEMLIEALRESTNKPELPIRFDLGAELMDATLYFPDEWIELRDFVRAELAKPENNDIRPYITLSHNFCHHIEYLRRLDNHDEYFTRIADDLQIHENLQWADRPAITHYASGIEHPAISDETRYKIGRYMVGLDEISLSQYMPLDIFTPQGEKTTPKQVYDALLFHERQFIQEVLINELKISPEEMPILHIGEYGMGWRGLHAPNVWDRVAWTAAGNGHLLLDNVTQKEHAAIAIEGIKMYINPEITETSYNSFLLWFGGAPYDLLNINSHSNWSNAAAIEDLTEYWDTHQGAPTLIKITDNDAYEYAPPTGSIVKVSAGEDILKTISGIEAPIITIIGSATTEEKNATISSYVWTLNGKTIGNSATLKYAFPVGKHQLTLTCYDSEGNKGTDKIKVAVESDTVFPTANAGKRQTITDMDNNGVESVQLDGSASVAEEGEITYYKWFLNDVEIANVAKPIVDFVIGTHKVELSVTNTSGATSFSEVVIIVKPFVAVNTTIANFEGYNSNTSLQADWIRNTSGGNISLTLNTEKAQEGTYCAQIDYDLTSSTYAGFEYQSMNQNWVNTEGLKLWVESDGLKKDLTLQFYELSGEVWEATVEITGSSAREIFIPYSDFGQPSWAQALNGTLELSTITKFAIYVERESSADPIKGTIYIDNIRAAREVEDNPTNIDKVERNLLIYPNPVSSFVVFELPKAPDEEVAIHLYNLAGQCVLNMPKAPMKGSKILLDLSSLQIHKGIYVYTIVTANNIYKGKIIYSK